LGTLIDDKLVGFMD